MLAVMATYLCPQDGTRAETTSLTWCCPVCSGPWDLDFEVAGRLSLDSLAGRVNSLWRYAEALPLSSPATSLGEGRTPLVPLTRTVSAKLDFLMPTLSFKDRGAVMLAELARRLSPERVVADSSGNAGTAVAAYCARAGLACTVYVPEGTSPKKTEQIRAHGARLEIVPGDREATALAARAAADSPAPSTPRTSSTRTSCTARRHTSTRCGKTSAAGFPTQSPYRSATARCSSARPWPPRNSTPRA